MQVDYRANVFITGGAGMLGRALVDELVRCGFENIYAPSSRELNLLDEEKVSSFILANKPDYVFHLASLVYGLKGNMSNQFSALASNTDIYANVLKPLGLGWKPKKIFFAGTVASYGFPYVQQPIIERDVFQGVPHDGEFGYAMAKRHAFNYLKIAKDIYDVDYVYGLLTNLYGPYDTFDSENGHVIPSLIKKAVEASNKGQNEFEVWGNSSSTRDFLYIKDAAKAVVHLMMCGHGIYNISTGVDKSMAELARSISNGLDGKVSPCWNSNQPVGISNRSVSNEKLKSTGFDSYTDFDKAINETICWYKGSL
jgi:GDP-L-fucose synthase